MAKQVNYVKDIVDNYRVEDIVAYLDRGMSVAVQTMGKAADTQNLAQFGSVTSVVTEAWAIIHKLNEKLNGSNSNEVL